MPLFYANISSVYLLDVNVHDFTFNIYFHSAQNCGENIWTKKHIPALKKLRVLLANCIFNLNI